MHTSATKYWKVSISSSEISPSIFELYASRNGSSQLTENIYGFYFGYLRNFDNPSYSTPQNYGDNSSIELWR